MLERICAEHLLSDWQGLGLAVQAYQKRATAVIDYVAGLAGRYQRRIMVRLVKGAYWDSEIKRAQERGLPGYPVFTFKEATDVSYLACARRLFAAGDVLYPMFATHNAHTIAAIVELARQSANRPDFEFQRLHGMGEPLYKVLQRHRQIPCRVYAPVGSHEVLLAYLVRRLLENGANTSFVNRLSHCDLPVEDVVADPCEMVSGLLEQGSVLAEQRIPLPSRLYADRKNSTGLNLHDEDVIGPLLAWFETARQQRHARSDSAVPDTAIRSVVSPIDHNDVVGEVTRATETEADTAMAAAAGAFAAWQARPVEERAVILERVADIFEARRNELMALIIREGGRCIADALSELREAVDFARYYAVQLRRQFAGTLELPGPTGEYTCPVPAWPRCVCCHQSVEFSIGDFFRPDTGCPGGRELCGRQAGRTDAVDRA